MNVLMRGCLVVGGVLLARIWRRKGTALEDLGRGRNFLLFSREVLDAAVPCFRICSQIQRASN